MYVHMFLDMHMYINYQRRPIPEKYPAVAGTRTKDIAQTRWLRGFQLLHTYIPGTKAYEIKYTLIHGGPPGGNYCASRRLNGNNRWSYIPTQQDSDPAGKNSPGTSRVQEYSQHACTRLQEPLSVLPFSALFSDYPAARTRTRQVALAW